MPTAAQTRLPTTDVLAACFLLPVVWAFGYALLYSLGVIQAVLGE